ncbi:MAG: peptidylprolyl isomerase [Proteobacteria bacterium]|nr:peptidylprolyl isomerase [Pseudomonadota bacterium]
MKIRHLTVLTILATLFFVACDSSKQGPEEKVSGKPSKQAVKERPSDAPANPAALAKVADRYVLVADYERQLIKFPPKFADSEQGRKYVLNQIIDHLLIQKEAEAQGLTQDPAIVSKIEDYTRNLYRNSLLQSIKTGQKTITDEEAKKYFQEHEEELIQPDRVHLSVIDLGPDKEKEINALYRQLRAGKDFAELAKAHSMNVSAGRGGDLGFLTRKQHKHLTDVAFALKPGDISRPFKSPAGWSIIRVHEIIKKQSIPLEEGIKRAKARLEGMETAKAFDALMKSVREKYEVVLYEERVRHLQPAGPPK